MALAARSPPISCVRYTGKRDIGVSHHHITRASPVDDTHAEVSQDSFLRMLCAGLLLCARCVLVRCVQLHRRTTMVQV